jgi:hypothetical protein
VGYICEMLSIMIMIEHPSFEKYEKLDGIYTGDAHEVLDDT